MTKVVGIDFGTTNIRIAEWDVGSGDNPSSSQIGEGGRLSYMPAVLAFRRQQGGDVEKLFGEDADRLNSGPNLEVIRNIKRYALASDDYVRDQLESDLEDKGESWPTWFDHDSRSVRVWNQTIYAEEAIRLLLKEAISRAGLAGAAAEWRAGCPVNSDLTYRRALVGALADLGCQGRVEWILQEPLLLPALGREIRSLEQEGIYMVYDLGGGSFDCAVAKVTSNQLIVLAEHGLTMGGMDIDDMLAKELEPEGPLKGLETAELRIAKEQLSSQARQDLPGGYTLTTELDHKVLENGGFIPSTLSAMEKAYDKARLLIDSPPEAGVKGMVKAIDKVLVVGGPTRMPYFIDKLGDIFGAHKVVSADELTRAADRSDIVDPALTALSHGACYMYGNSLAPLVVDRVPAEIVLSVTDGKAVEEDELHPYRKLPDKPPLAPHQGKMMVRRPLYRHEATTLSGDVDSEYSVVVRSPDGEILNEYGPFEMRMPRDYTGPRADRVRLIVDRLGGIQVRLEAGFTHVPSPSHDIIDIELNPPWQPDLQQGRPELQQEVLQLLAVGRKELAASPNARVGELPPYDVDVRAAYGDRRRRA